ncbi:MAG: hypothetical protein ACC628_09770 [Pirellulaceae bacterium]
MDGRGTLHFRFHKKASRFQMRNVRVVDADTGRDLFPVGSFATMERFDDVWNVWPPGERNTVGTVEVENAAVHVTLTEPPGGNWPDFHLHSDIRITLKKGRTYRCSFEVNCSARGEVIPALYCVDGGVWDLVGGLPGPFLRQVGLARDAGIRFISTSMSTCWHAPEEPEDWEGIDAVMRRIIDVNPRALIVPRISANAPPWWLERHPEARMMFEDGKPGRLSTVSSRPYRRDVSAHIDLLCSPISYFDRQWRGTGASMTAAESVMMHGKLWLNEDDGHPHRERAEHLA